MNSSTWAICRGGLTLQYQELIDILRDKENPNVLDYIDDAVLMLEELWEDLKASNERYEILRNMLAKYTDEIVPGYQKVADKWEKLVPKIREDLVRATLEKYAAIETIFKYAGCEECKWWDDKDKFCKKQGKNAVLYDWFCSPVWRGAKEDELGKER